MPRRGETDGLGLNDGPVRCLDVFLALENRRVLLEGNVQRLGQRQRLRQPTWNLALRQWGPGLEDRFLRMQGDSPADDNGEE